MLDPVLIEYDLTVRWVAKQGCFEKPAYHLPKGMSPECMEMIASNFAAFEKRVREFSSAVEGSDNGPR